MEEEYVANHNSDDDLSELSYLGLDHEIMLVTASKYDNDLHP